MIVERSIVNEMIPKPVLEFIDESIRFALDIDGNGEFVVNPTTFFRMNNGKITPAVINSADYISKRFQQRLSEIGWQPEKTVVGQRIDAFIETRPFEIPVHFVEEDGFRDSVRKIIDSEYDAETVVSNVNTLYEAFLIRRRYQWPLMVAEKILNERQMSTRYSIGLEFETGNIASSFRALSKLNYIYSEQEIDVGIFVTTATSKAAHLIWPPSNRNGSLTELKQRKFESAVRFPAIVYGFSPDQTDTSVGYLGKDGERFYIDDAPQSNTYQGREYLYYPKYDIYRPR